ncbi:hypothetical protein SFIMM107S_00724 [Streptomyces griseus]
MSMFQLLLAALLVLANGFFVGAEFALVSVRRSQIEPLAAQGSGRARTVLHGLENLPQMMAAAQFGITVCSLTLGAVAEPTVAHLLEPVFHAAHVPDGLVHPLGFALALLSVETGQGHRGQVRRLVVPVALHERRQPGGGVHERRVDPVHRPVQRQGGRTAPGALVGPRQPVAQFLALRLLAAAAHQRGRQQRLRLPEHLQPHPRHPAEQPRLDAQHRIVDELLGAAHQLLPVLDQIRAAGVQEPHLRIRVHRRQSGQRPVQLRHMAPVQPVRGVRQQQIARALQHRLHPPAQPVPGVERTSVACALFAEAVAVPVHAQQGRGGVDAQRVEAEPAVRHAGIEPHRGSELLLGLRVGAHRVGVHATQPGEVGRGSSALCADVHQVPHKPCPQDVPPAQHAHRSVLNHGVEEGN